ncbi:hypothetical protein Tsp_13133 [Trichinella spiralis]|nr:hypothetical protein Tsp_13133 [Trichinella spiralis]
MGTVNSNIGYFMNICIKAFAFRKTTSHLLSFYNGDHLI